MRTGATSTNRVEFWDCSNMSAPSVHTSGCLCFPCRCFSLEFPKQNCSKNYTATFVLFIGTLLSLLVCVTANLEHVRSEYQFTTQSEFQSYLNFTEKEMTLDLPIITWWTKGPVPHAEKISYIKCPNSQCYVTTLRKFVEDPRARGFIFYGTDFSPGDVPLPRKRHHEWALLHEESPMNNYVLSHGAAIGMFNHTSTFRRESDYPLSSQYIFSLDYLISRPVVPIKLKNQIKMQMKLAPVLYVQSHCNVPSDRDTYVKELMRHIEIDSYGSCLHNKDLPESLSDPVESMFKEEFLNFMANYKFQITFENAICKDYMTEKLFRAMHVGSVPIYKGSPSIKDWVPTEKSVIVADDFSTPEKLAEFIKHLDKNDAEYMKYLSYKTVENITNKFLLKHLSQRQWDDASDFITGFECHVCDNVFKRQQIEKAHAKDNTVELLPPKIARMNHLGCPQPHPSLPDTEKESEEMQDWISLYWSDFDQALGLREMILQNETDSKKFSGYWEKALKKSSRRT
ncbi:alpha-(1,3)-fucosyltransferase 11 [Lingula anatina]|uniref:Fucosyltransferase n=1 Tax=Lingula anatina TaxID=7574 RepID=A0A1S3HT90_LINAN|nr:alpha-(1,3)-fucosyltransferase 11 [Lingula anatina]|eukprot:XP_013388771.1 alpha-(1,3)-fucosyltransferase 11 [Lingula anatina]